MIRSNEFHELGLEMAKNSQLNKVQFLIDKICYELKIEIKNLFLFPFGENDYLFCIEEIEGDKFAFAVYENENSEEYLIYSEIYTWHDDEVWSDLDIFEITKRFILANRQTFSDLLKLKPSC